MPLFGSSSKTQIATTTTNIVDSQNRTSSRTTVLDNVGSVNVTIPGSAAGGGLSWPVLALVAVAAVLLLRGGGRR